MKNESSGKKKKLWERGNVDFVTGKEVNNKELFKNNGDIKDTGVLNDGVLDTIITKMGKPSPLSSLLEGNVHSYSNPINCLDRNVWKCSLKER